MTWEPHAAVDVGEQRQVHLVVLSDLQHGVCSLDHRCRPVLAVLVEDPGSAVEHVGPGPAMDVRGLPGRPERKVLGAERDRAHVGPIEQTCQVPVGGPIGPPSTPCGHPGDRR